MLERLQYFNLWKQLSQYKPLLLLAGPRQSGKTTFSKQILKGFSNSLYYNWDIIADKQKIISDPYFFVNINRIDESAPFVVFDELHKYKNWKNYIKGVYDKYNDEFIFLVTGSGRLDVFRKGGDSLAGRYLIFHIFPFTLSELSARSRDIRSEDFDWFRGFKINNSAKSKEIWDNLSLTSGFPEPFIKATREFYNLWSNTYIHQVVTEDIRNFSDVKHTDLIEVLYSLLPSKVGSTFSSNSVAQDLGVSFDTIKSWMLLFETVFLTFKIEPWTKKISRSILKEKKWYLYDYAAIIDEAAKFENMVALELYRLVTLWNEHGYGNYKLNYIRNKEKKEVDFVLCESSNPLLLVETKLSDTNISKNLLYFQDILNVPAIQLVNKPDIYIYNAKNRIMIVTAHDWLSSF